MTEYRRFRHSGGTWFFTVNLAERHGNRLLMDRIDMLRSAFAHVKSKHSFEIAAAVILPDHLHCIWTLPDGDSDFSRHIEKRREDFPKPEKTGRKRLVVEAVLGAPYP